MHLSLLKAYAEDDIAAMSDEEARELFVKMRWLGAIRCPRCGAIAPYRLRRARGFACRECACQFSTLSRTVFAHHKMGYSALLLAIYLLLTRGTLSIRRIANAHGYEYKVLWVLNKKVNLALTGGTSAKLLRHHWHPEKVSAP